MVEKSPYSSVLEFFAAIDTIDESFPAPLNAESLPINTRLYYHFKSTAPDVTGKREMDVFMEGLRKRLESILTDE